MKLSQYLEKHDISDAEFGEAVGRHRITVGKWRRGLVRPDWDALREIEIATNGKVTADDFVPEPAKAGAS